MYQGVLLTELARAADIVLPGAAWVEKESTYTNDQGRVQGAAKVFDAAGRGARRPRHLPGGGEGDRADGAVLER